MMLNLLFICFDNTFKCKISSATMTSETPAASHQPRCAASCRCGRAAKWESSSTCSSSSAPKRRSTSTGRHRTRAFGSGLVAVGDLDGDAVCRAAFTARSGYERQRLVAFSAALGEDAAFPPRSSRRYQIPSVRHHVGVSRHGGEDRRKAACRGSRQAGGVRQQGKSTGGFVHWDGETPALNIRPCRG